MTSEGKFAARNMPADDLPWARGGKQPGTAQRRRAVEAARTTADNLIGKRKRAFGVSHGGHSAYCAWDDEAQGPPELSTRLADGFGAGSRLRACARFTPEVGPPFRQACRIRPFQYTPGGKPLAVWRVAKALQQSRWQAPAALPKEGVTDGGRGTRGTHLATA